MSTNNTVKNNDKLSVKAKLGYGSLEFSNSLVVVGVATFGLYFFTDVVGMAPGIAGTLVAMGGIIAAIAAPIVGVLSDNCKSKHGRRRPFIIGVAIPYAVVIWLYFTNWNLGTTAEIVYFAIMVILLQTCGCTLEVPFTSLGAEMTMDYDERTSLNLYRSVFSLVSSLIAGSFIISIAAYFTASAGGNADKGWSITSACMAIVFFLIVVFGWRATKGYERHRQDQQDKFSFKDFGHVFKNRVFRYTAGLYCAGVGAYAIATVTSIYFMSVYLQMNEGMITIGYAAYNLAAIAWLPLIPFVSNRYSKRAAWVVMMGLWGAALIAMFFLQPGDNIAFYVLMAVSGAGSMVCYTVGWSMLPDCIEVDEYKYGERKEGTYYGILSVVARGMSALITFIGGLALQFLKYDGTALVQSDFTVSGIRYLYVFGILLFIVISFIFAAKYPLNREKHAKLREAIDAKKEGKEYDMTGIEDLVK